jgi:RimJ/RimL family protein N-acetyltransferase
VDRAGADGAPVTLREPEAGDEAALRGLFAECGDWFGAATGLPSSPGDVQSLFYALSEGAAPEGEAVLVVAREGRGVGVVDAVRDHPEAGAVAVGMFLPAPRERGRGLGRAVAEGLLAREVGLRRVTATVPSGGTPGERFLERLGFVVGEPGSPGAGAVGNGRSGPREGTARRGRAKGPREGTARKGRAKGPRERAVRRDRARGRCEGAVRRAELRLGPP